MKPFNWSRATEAERRAYCAERNRVERAAQGLPEKIEDVSVLAQVAGHMRPYVTADRSAA